MTFKITTLIENTSRNHCLYSEHGLSLLIEGEGRRVLYDTGASPLFLKNAVWLNADLRSLDAVVLSHGHYDHTGGMDSIFSRHLMPGRIYLGYRFFGDRYYEKAGSFREIGAAFTLEALKESGIPYTEVGPEPISLGGGIYVISGFTSADGYEQPLASMQRRETDGIRKDLFEDEAVIVLETQKELALLSGCSHVGVISMTRRVKELFAKPVTCFIGGTHLVHAADERIAHTCEALKSEGVVHLGACHCSGERAALYFEKNFPGFYRNVAGTVVTVE